MVSLTNILADVNYSGVYRLNTKRSSRSLIKQITSSDPNRAGAIILMNEFINKQAVIADFANSLNFPVYFGYNWDALEECLNDPTWQEQRDLAIIIDQTHFFSDQFPEDWQILLDILKSTSANWRNNQRSFVVLVMG